MPVITRRQPLLDLRGKTASIALSDTLSLQSSDIDNDSKPLYFLTDESFAKKEMEFPGSVSPPRELKAASQSRSNLRPLTTQSSLHSCYQSSEEDISPNPDSSSACSSSDEAEEPTPKTIFSTDADIDADTVPALDDSTDADSDSDYPVPMTPPAIATRISFFHAGRPKLISIAALAPMQKRKRAIPPPIPIRHIDSYSQHNTNSFPSPNPSSKYHSAPTSPPAKRPTTAIRTKASPAVWLPTEHEGEDAMSLSESEEAEELLLGKNGASPSNSNAMDDDTHLDPTIRPFHEHEQELYFPPAELTTCSPTPTTYAEYDPYSLDPPRLSGGSNEFSRQNAYARKYAAFAEKGYGTYSPAASVWEGERERKRGWKGLGIARVVGFGKKGGSGNGVGGGNGEGKGSGGFEVGMGKRMEGGMLPAFVFEE